MHETGPFPENIDIPKMNLWGNMQKCRSSGDWQVAPATLLIEISVAQTLQHGHWDTERGQQTGATNIYLLLVRHTDPWMIDVSTRTTAFGPKIPRTLLVWLEFHAFDGCDTTSASLGKQKVIPLKNLDVLS